MQNSIKLATATEVQNNFGKYLQYAIDQGEVVILRNGKRVARLVSDEVASKSITESLLGVLKGSYSDEDVRAARTAKYRQED